MIATASSAFLLQIYSPGKAAKTCSKYGGLSGSLDVRGVKAKSCGGFQVKANAQAPLKVSSGSKIGVMDGFKKYDTSKSHTLRTFINQLPDWSMLLAAITTIFLAAEKQWTMMLQWKTKRTDHMLTNQYPFGLGRIVQDGMVFRQNFSIRSYEIGADRTISVETLMNHLQETALNHVKNVGLLGDGFGATPEMVKRNLIWVMGKMQVLVDRYPTWGDVVQVDTWLAASGKNGMRCDWLVRDCKKGDILTRATSLFLMINKNTRRVSRMSDEVCGEIGRHFVDTPPIVDEDARKLPKLDENIADCLCDSLSPRWSDLDVNQHVNNVKYVGWVFECALQAIVEGYELAGMSVEYRRECKRDSVLQSLTKILSIDDENLVADSAGHVECQHLLRLESGAEILKGRTLWRPKHASKTTDE